MDAVIFDLDSCLAAADEPGRSLYATAFEAMQRENRGALTAAQLEAAFEDTWRLPLDVVAQRHGFPAAMEKAGWEAMRKVEVTALMRGYGDLDALRSLDVRRFLVTSGFRGLQESKIRALGIAELFSEIMIDAIDEPDARGKEPYFRELQERHRKQVRNFWVVGDNPDSEIRAGNALGMTTVQILRPGVTKGDNARYHIQSLTELGPLLDGSGPTLG